MAKREVAVAEADAAEELKRELNNMLRPIIEEEKDEVAFTAAIDRAKELLSSLRDLHFQANKTTPLPLWVDHVSVSCPHHFRCPLSNNLMTDPVIVATGQTFDKPFIQKWLKAGNRTCPTTHQVLSHTLLTPNCLIKDMISKWCSAQGIRLPDRQSQYISKEDGMILESDRDNFFSLLEKISSPSIPAQKSAAKELRLLTKRLPSFRALFGESTDSIPQLLKPLADQNSSTGLAHPDLQEDLVTTLLNLSIHDSNKKLVAETPMVIPVLIESLRRGTINARSNSAAALFTLSALDSNKALIGQSGALGPLIDLLNDVGCHPLAIKDAASAIFNLCIFHENKARAVKQGAVKVLLRRIKTGVHVDELLAILAMLSTQMRAIEELGELGGVSCLLGITRESPCAQDKENCVSILYSICMNDRTKLREMRDEERAYGTLSKLASDGTSRAKRKVNGILERLNRAMLLTHTA